MKTYTFLIFSSYSKTPLMNSPAHLFFRCVFFFFFSWYYLLTVCKQQNSALPPPTGWSLDWNVKINQILSNKCVCLNVCWISIRMSGLQSEWLSYKLANDELESEHNTDLSRFASSIHWTASSVETTSPVYTESSLILFLTLILNSYARTVCEFILFQIRFFLK